MFSKLLIQQPKCLNLIKAQLSRNKEISGNNIYLNECYQNYFNIQIIILRLDLQAQEK